MLTSLNELLPKGDSFILLYSQEKKRKASYFTFIILSTYNKATMNSLWMGKADKLKNHNNTGI